MVWFLYIVSFMWIAAGSAAILHTEKVRGFMQWFMEDANLKVWGVGIILFGVLLAIASFWSGVVWFLFLIALVGIGKGVFFVAADGDKVRSLIGAWINISDAGIRLWGLIWVIAGVAVLAWT